jgi:hypothetical protein
MIPAHPSSYLDSSASPQGQAIYLQLERVREGLRSSYSQGDVWNKSRIAIDEILRECSHPDWDGYHAIPLHHQTARNARQFAEALPPQFPAPQVSATVAGDITFEWAQSHYRTVTVAVDEHGKVHYAAINGNAKAFGSFPLVDVLGSPIFSLIASVLG